jgi:hypothetical protein
MLPVAANQVAQERVVAQSPVVQMTQPTPTLPSSNTGSANRSFCHVGSSLLSQPLRALNALPRYTCAPAIDLSTPITAHTYRGHKLTDGEGAVAPAI